MIVVINKSVVVYFSLSASAENNKNNIIHDIPVKV